MMLSGSTLKNVIFVVGLLAIAAIPVTATVLAGYAVYEHMTKAECVCTLPPLPPAGPKFALADGCTFNEYHHYGAADDGQGRGCTVENPVARENFTISSSHPQPCTPELVAEMHRELHVEHPHCVQWSTP